MTTRPWDAFEAEAADYSGSTEETRATEDAHGWALQRAVEQFGEVPYALGGSRLRLLLPAPYVAEVRGQSSATGHGKQGAHPDRIAEARALEYPVLMVFKDQGIIWSVWLHNPGPDIVWITHDPARKRQGWWCKQMARELEGTFCFPEHVPTYESGGLF